MSEDLFVPALLAVLLAGCSDGVSPWAPPVAVNYTFQPGYEIVCAETLFRMGLPDAGIFQVIGFGKREWKCELHRKPPLEHYK
jgi:hypothetical protein